MGELRRSKGTGTAPRWLDDTKRWQARYTAADGRRRSVYSRLPGPPGQRECSKLRDQAIAAAAAGVDPTLQPLAEYLEAYLARRTSLEPASRERYARLVKVHVRAGDRNVLGKAIAAIPLARLRTDDLEDLYRARLRAGASPKSIELLHTLIHGALAQATARGRLVRNPADGAERPTVRRIAPDVYTPAQLRELVDAGRDTEHAAFVAVLATTGQRLGELLDLRWADVDLERGRLTIRAPEKGGVPHGVPLAPSVVRALQVVQELLGHRTFRQTADTYSHVTEGMLAQVAAAMERAVGE